MNFDAQVPKQYCNDFWVKVITCLLHQKCMTKSKQHFKWILEFVYDPNATINMDIISIENTSIQTLTKHLWILVHGWYPEKIVWWKIKWLIRNFYLAFDNTVKEVISFSGILCLHMRSILSIICSYYLILFLQIQNKIIHMDKKVLYSED